MHIDRATQAVKLMPEHAIKSIAVVGMRCKCWKWTDESSTSKESLLRWKDRAFRDVVDNEFHSTRLRRFYYFLSLSVEIISGI